MAAIYAVLNFGLPYCVLRSNLRKSERAINTKSCAQWVFVNNEMGQTAENILTSLSLSLSLSSYFSWKRVPNFQKKISFKEPRNVLKTMHTNERHIYEAK